MPGVQYPTHVPLNILQKGAVASLSAIGALIRYDNQQACRVLVGD
jgi:hypothetical protein